MSYGSDLLVVQRAAAGRTLDDIALDMVGDDAAHVRAYGGRDPRWLDDAWRIKLAQAERPLERYRARVTTKKARA
jgi:hypothetical protein